MKPLRKVLGHSEYRLGGDRGALGWRARRDLNPQPSDPKSESAVKISLSDIFLFTPTKYVKAPYGRDFAAHADLLACRWVPIDSLSLPSVPSILRLFQRAG